jgi:murein L,D-transpeptidase YcbB/YkuD
MGRPDFFVGHHGAGSSVLLVVLIFILLGEPVAAREGYEGLEEALERYRRAAVRAEPVPPGPALKLGAEGERVVALRERLAAVAEAEGAGPLLEPELPEVFDFSLEMAVRDFQERHGLAPDGIAGASTLAEVNRTAEEQIRKIEVNLERWRRLPTDFGERYILVNIAAFRLDAVEDGRSVLDMKVIVGRTDSRTPVVSSAIEDVVLNPSWYVPKGIASREILPKGRSYLRRNGFQILPDGKLRQKPGPNNSLGQVKFRFPNRFGVYLHDTSARSLFDRAVRALSHGCVRVERPEDLAAWVLRDAPQWSEEAIQDALDSGHERRVELPEPIPVHIVYWTAWVDDAGALRFGPDVYDQDRDVLVSREVPSARQNTLPTGRQP